MKSCDGRHMCEPPDYPTSMNDRWTCGACGMRYAAVRAADNPLLSRLPGISPDQLGWASL